ncbi:MAG: DUF2789 family protein [Azonexus sp.]
MEAQTHSMASLFAQLGLSAEPADIDKFITERRPLSNGTTLCNAPFWTEVQSRFLKEEIIWDADWAGVIDELNARLSK